MNKSEKDPLICEFIEKFHAARMSHISRMFYKEFKHSDNLARRRLLKLTERKHLNRTREHLNAEFVYYMGKKSRNVYHHLLVTELYVTLNELKSVEILHINVEKKIKDLQPDAYIILKHNGKVLHYFVEVHRSNNPLDKKIEKYNKLSEGDFQEYFPEIKELFPNAKKFAFPKLLFITDRKVSLSPVESLELIIADENLTELESKL